MAEASWTLRLDDFTLTAYAFKNGRVRKVAKVLVDSGCIHAVNDKGEFFSNMVQGGQLFYGRHDRRSLAMLAAAAQLGLVPGKAILAAKREHEKLDQARAKKWAARDLETSAQQLGIDLPASIKRQITRAKSAA